MLLETLPDPVLIDCERGILYANRRATAFLGYERKEQLVGRRIAALCDSGSASVFLASLPAGATPQATKPLGEACFLRPDGSTVEAAAHGAPFPWLGEMGRLIVLRDLARIRKTEKDLQARITELELTKELLEKSSSKYAELVEQLHRAKEAADAANQTKSEFLANMSHELRTPLNAIMGFSEVVKDEMFGPVGLPQYVEYARDIYNSGAHLLEIINDILDLSKVEAGRFELSEEEIALDEIVSAVRNLVKGRAADKDIALEAFAPRDLPRLYGDKRTVKQMLLNLTSNAVKFTGRGGRVALAAECAPDGGIRLSVRDNGIGISEEDMDRVLAPFGQIDSPLAREHQGTGLGLPLVKAMVGLHGGELVIESAEGRGTIATLRFPAMRSMPRRPAVD